MRGAGIEKVSDCNCWCYFLCTLQICIYTQTCTYIIAYTYMWTCICIICLYWRVLICCSVYMHVVPNSICIKIRLHNIYVHVNTIKFPLNSVNTYTYVVPNGDAGEWLAVLGLSSLCLECLMRMFMFLLWIYLYFEG